MSSSSSSGAPAVPQSNIIKLAKDVVAGTCGGVSVTLTGHPFDTIKVRLQTQSPTNPMYKGMIDCARKTIAQEGFFGLYKGVQSPLVGQMFFRASLFGVMGGAKRWLATNADGSKRTLSYLDYYKAGFITGFCAAFTEGPIDFYKSQVQVQIIRMTQDPSYKPPFTNMWQCVKQSFQYRGLLGPFQGIGPTILRNAPANAAYLGSFEVMKCEAAAAMNCDTTELPPYVILGAAGLGGCMYWTLIFPVDVIKSAMQTDNLKYSERQYYGFTDTVRKLWAQGGVKRFYRGFAPCMVRAAPANAVMLYTVDTVNNFLNK